MTKKTDFQVETLTAQAAGFHRTGHSGLVPSLELATTYDRSHGPGPVYTRDQNPSYLPAEELLATLEHGSQAMLFSSGMAAATSVIESLESGQRIVAPKAMYWALRRWLSTFAARRGVEVTWVTPHVIDEWQVALRREAQLVWIETPANPLLELTDISAVSELAHRAGAQVVVDNTTATPILTQPLRLGADLVMHSATKSLNGHSDVLAGALVVKDAGSALWAYCRAERAMRGAVLGPFEAWLLLRGMRTLPLRVRQASQSAAEVAQFLKQHPSVLEVFYPGLAMAEQRELANKQMCGGFGSLLSFRVRGGGERAARVVKRLELFRDATSLGGVESLVEQRARVEGPASGLPDDLLRLSIGIEACGDLVIDLMIALEE
ncbi:MAG: hypothetical protein RJA70_233 [Pseudomonadota bacterium]